MQTLLIVITAAILALGAWREEAQAGLCVKRNGVLYFRTGACKKRETSITPDAIGAAGPKGDPGPTGDPGPDGGLHLVNSAGQLIGIFDLDFEVLIRSPVDGLLIGVSGFSEAGFIDQSVILYHESMDCAGAPLFRESVSPVIRFGRIRGDQVFYAGDPVTMHTAILSTQQPQTSCAPPDTITSLGLCCHNANPGARSVGPLQTFDAAPVFGSPPFTLRP